MVPQNASGSSDAPVCPEHSIPEEMYHREISIGVPMVDEVKCLLLPEPGESAKLRSFHMVFFIQIYMRIEGRRTSCSLNQEEIQGQKLICYYADQNHWNEKEGRVVSFFAKICLGDQMVFRIKGVVKINVISKQASTHLIMSQLLMHHRLRERHDQVGNTNRQEVQ